MDGGVGSTMNLKLASDCGTVVVPGALGKGWAVAVRPLTSAVGGRRVSRFALAGRLRQERRCHILGVLGPDPPTARRVCLGVRRTRAGPPLSPR